MNFVIIVNSLNFSITPTTKSVLSLDNKETGWLTTSFKSTFAKSLIMLDKTKISFFQSILLIDSTTLSSIGRFKFCITKSEAKPISTTAGIASTSISKSANLATISLATSKSTLFKSKTLFSSAASSITRIKSTPMFNKREIDSLVLML